MIYSAGKILDFYLPKYKYELVNMLSKIYPKDKNKFNRYNKKRLYAIYITSRLKLDKV